MKKKIFYGLLILGLLAYLGQQIRCLANKPGEEVRRGDSPQDTYQLGQGDQAPWSSQDFSFLGEGLNVLAASQDHIWASGDQARVLYKSQDLGETFVRVQEFPKKIEGIHISDRGDIFVSLNNNRWSGEEQGEVHKSSNQKDFKKVLTLEAGTALNWNMASRDNLVYISEYGNKNLPNNARRIYRSEDYGETFQVIYRPEARQGYHNHKILIDRRDPNIIYQSVGDDRRYVLRSLDGGASWEKIIDDAHPTSMLDLGDYILMGLDGQPRFGLLRYDKATGATSYAFLPERSKQGPIYDIGYDGENIYIGLTSYSQKDNHWDGTIYRSRDGGLSFQEILHWPKLNEESGIGFYNLIYKNENIFTNGQFPVYKDGRPGHFLGTLRLKVDE